MGHLTVYPGNIAGNLTKIFQKSQMPRGLPGGGMGGFGIDRYITSDRSSFMQINNNGRMKDTG